MTHAATPETARARPAPFAWEDPFLLEDQLTEDERMIWDAARTYARGAFRRAWSRPTPKSASIARS